MKVVGFKALKNKKKTKKVQIFCWSNVFSKLMMGGGFLLAFFVIGLFNKTFSLGLKECIQNFVSSMGKIKF